MALRVLTLIGLFTSFLVSSAQPGQVLKFVGRHLQLPASFDVGSAEVVAYDPSFKTAIVSDLANNRISYINVTNPAAPTLIRNVLLGAYAGVVNSVAIKNGLVAVALEAIPKTDPGKVLFFDMNGVFKSMATVGSQPDMLAFTPDGLRVVVCNEGEANSDYTVDPEGSVSIVNVTNQNSPTVQNVMFSSLNASKDSLKHMGIRVYGPNATVAQDFEPEYAAISADGKWAYVTLQENNAIAVVDITTATLTKVVALGYKDYSKGRPKSTNYPWTNRPVLGTTPAGQSILLGGFSSLWFEGYGSNSNKLRFLTNPDRGPNGEPITLRGQPRRPFALPNFQCEVVRFEFDKSNGSFTILNRVPLWRTNGTTPISGRPNLQAAGQGIAFTDEFGIDLNGNDIPNDPFGADLEGIAVDASGSWWMVDEYRPAIYNFNAAGVLIARYVPQGTAASVGAAAGSYGTELLPAVYATRRANRGFEACAMEGDILYSFIQSPLDNPDLSNDNSSKASTFCRIVAMNVVTKQIVGEYLYPMHEKAGLCDKIGDATSIGNGKFLVVERDDATGLKARKYIFEMDLKGATNIYNMSISIPPGKSTETLSFSELAARGVKPVHKKKSVYLPGAGYGNWDKVEGLTRIDANTWAVMNDNDFGVGGSILPNPPNGTITLNPNAIPTLGLITFDNNNGFDGSDRDNIVNIRNWPVYGMYEPDGIATINVGGETFLVTANEGDAREYDNFVEEARISSSSVPLDPVRFASWPNLKTNGEIGRLNVTNTLGDLDGDGIFDELYTLGGRGFSIWNTDGNLIWDSGQDFESKIAAFYPANFNTGHTTNAFDDRSDNKGPEPEGVTVGVINDSVYAFVNCERIGGIFMYNVSNVSAPKYIDYINSRNFAVTPNVTNIGNLTVGDLGPEVVAYVPNTESPNAGDMLIAGNEISGTTSLYQIRIPRIGSIPAASMPVCIGDKLTMTVQATGVDLTYQWNRNGVDIPTATAATYTVDVAGQAQAGTYACKVTADGGMSITPRSTVVTVFEKTKITLEPKALTQVDDNVTVFLKVDATSNSGETYQWYKAGTPLVNNAKYAGVTSKELTIRFVGFADTSSAYYCIVTGGCNSVRSKNAAVFIPRILITQQPASVNVCPGVGVQFSVVAQPTGGDKALIYRWKIPYGAYLVDDGRITGSQTPTLHINDVSAQDINDYACVITGYPSGEPLFSNNVKLMVEPRPTIVRQPAVSAGSNHLDMCDAETKFLRVAADGKGIEYQWYKNGNAIPLATDAMLQTQQPGIYVVRVTGSCESNFAESDPVTIEAKEKPQIRLQVPFQTRLKKGSDLELSFTLRYGSPVISYQWYHNGALIPGANAIAFKKSGVIENDGGVYYCKASNMCGYTVTQNANVVVYEDKPVSVNEVDANGYMLSVDPNPMRQNGTVSFEIPASGIVLLQIVDAQGRLVATLANEFFDAGTHYLPLTTSFNTLLTPHHSPLTTSGAYYVKMETGATVITRPLIVID